MNGNKLKGRPFRDEDVQIIVEEVEFLMNGGYRAPEKKQVLKGLKVALKKSPKDEWKRWTGVQLRNVIDELFELGTV